MNLRMIMRAVSIALSVTEEEIKGTPIFGLGGTATDARCIYCHIAQLNKFKPKPIADLIGRDRSAVSKYKIRFDNYFGSSLSRMILATRRTYLCV